MTDYRIIKTETVKGCGPFTENETTYEIHIETTSAELVSEIKEVLEN